MVPTAARWSENSLHERENTPETLPVELDLICIEKDDWLEFYYDYLRLKEKESNGEL